MLLRRIRPAAFWRSGSLCRFSSEAKVPVSDEEDLYGDDSMSDELEYSDQDGDALDVFLGAGKSHYRRREKLPEWVVAKKHEIRQNRTMAQIRRCLKDWMVTRSKDNKNASSYRERSLEWKETQKKLGDNRVSEGTLQVKAYGAEETVAYMHYFYPGKFSIHRRVFRDITTFLGPSFQPKKMLDFGCGPGTAAAAAIDVWGDRPEMLYSGVDMSHSMLDAAKIMLDGRATQRIFYDRMGSISKRALESGEAYDLIVCSYTLSELANDHLRRTATQLLYEILAVDGVLVFIEGGGPAGSHTTRTARQFLISTGASSYQSQNSRDKRKSKHAEEAPDTVPAVIAPCTHSKECPLTGGVWCSFSQAVEGGMLNKTNEEKYSYVAIQKKHASSDNGGDEEDYDEGAMHHDHDHDHEDGDFTLSIPLQHRDWGRIVRSPIKKRGHVVMDVCYPSGTLGRSVVSRGNGEGRIPVFYRAARKAQWGGLYPASNFATIETEADIPFS